jgi:hypothetical protein
MTSRLRGRGYRSGWISSDEIIDVEPKVSRATV